MDATTATGGESAHAIAALADEASEQRRSGGQRGEGQRERRKAGTHLCGNGGLDLCALLLLALEDGRCVSGDVLETVDDVRMLSRNLEVARGVGVCMGRVSARWGGHGRVGDGVRERRTLGFQVGNSGRGGTERWNAERTRKGVSILYSREDVRGTFGVFCHVRWVQMAQAPARTASHCRSARKIRPRQIADDWCLREQR